ncbi:hypothetical protein [Oxynema sp. CENA135]|nr:hypothetical protein [Oxynema sp. CENA135]
MRKLTAIEHYPGNQRPTSRAGVRVRDSKGGSPIASHPHRQ